MCFFCLSSYCRKGEALFRSDNMSTISVLKEVLSKEATQRKIAIKMTHGMYIQSMITNPLYLYTLTHFLMAELDDASVPHMLGLIYPRLEGQLLLAKNVQLIEALQEVQIHEEDTTFFSPQCQFILG